MLGELLGDGRDNRPAALDRLNSGSEKLVMLSLKNAANAAGGRGVTAVLALPPGEKRRQVHDDSTCVVVAFAMSQQSPLVVDDASDEEEEEEEEEAEYNSDFF